jgi:imidazolonepropionase-like amidohydrolase
MDYALTNCNIVDLENGKIIENTRIAVRGNSISSIDESASQESFLIDLDGAYVLHGLFNVHSHLSLPFTNKERGQEEAESRVAYRCYMRANDALNAGITTIRTVADSYRCDVHLRNLINSGRLHGPNIVANGKGI